MVTIPIELVDRFLWSLMPSLFATFLISIIVNYIEAHPPKNPDSFSKWQSRQVLRQHIIKNYWAILIGFFIFFFLFFTYVKIEGFT